MQRKVKPFLFFRSPPRSPFPTSLKLRGAGGHLGGVFGVFFLLIFFLWNKTFFLFFFQDDFFVLNKVSFSNILDFFSIFIPDKNVNYFRPLGVELFFWLSKSIFGLNPLGFHLVGFVFHLMNTFLVFLLARQITQKEDIALLTCFFYGISPLHFSSLSYIANFSFFLGAFFYFLTTLLYLKSLKDSKFLKYALVTFFLGLFSNEILMTFPLIVLSFSVLKKLEILFFERLPRLMREESRSFFNKEFSTGSNNKGYRTCPFLIASLPYFLLRLYFAPAMQGIYKPEVSWRLFSTLRWYVLWIFGWSETMKDQFISAFKINPIFILSFGKEFFMMEIVLFFTLFLTLVFPCALLIFQKKFLNEKISSSILFSFFWVLINLLPFLLLPHHSYPHYATVASFGIYLFLSFFYFAGFERLKNFLVVRYFTLVVIIFSWIFFSFFMFNFNLLIHWSVRHANLAKEFFQKVKKLYPQMPSSAKVFIIDNNGEKKLVLSETNAIQVFYNDKSINVEYITSDEETRFFGKKYEIEKLKKENIYLIP